jgi:hypothetical protein
MRRFEIVAVFLSLVGFLAAALVTWRVFEAVPHLEDEIAYVWQANVLAQGKITIPSPPHEKSFLVPFVVDYQGERFGKYPLGWPVMLALGVLANARGLVNPLLSGLGVWLTYLVGKRVFGAPVGLLAAALTVVSPFFLMNSGSLLSHPLGLALSAAFVLVWLKGFAEPGVLPRWPLTILAAVLLGALILTRPFTAVGVALPFALHGAYLFLFSRGDPARLRQLRLHLPVMALIILALASLHFLWQYLVTGDPFLNPYTLWWDYDKVGFGPGHGHSEKGHTLRQAWVNTRYSLQVGARDLFGWGSYSWILLPFGAWAALRRRQAWLVGVVFPVLVVLYLSYWVGADLFGPRYYYEGLFTLTIFSAAGLGLLAGWPLTKDRRAAVDEGSHSNENSQPLIDAISSKWMAPGWLRLPLLRLQPPPRLANLFAALQRLRPWLVMTLLVGMVVYNLVAYTPQRLSEMYGLYGISRSDLDPFLTPEAEDLAPALFIVHARRWMPYGSLHELQDPFLTTPFIFAWSRTPERDAALRDDFPDRSVYHYYPEDPYTFYTISKP